MYLDKTVKNLMATLGAGVVGFGFEGLKGLFNNLKHIRTTRDLYIFLTVFGVGGILIFGRRTYKAFKLYLKYRDISKDVQHIGEALLHALINTGIMSTGDSELEVKTSVDDWGTVFCHLKGGTTFDQSTFVDALQEIIAPVDNPRYVIVRKSRFLWFVKQKDYHAVPEILGKNKRLAEQFKIQWQHYVGRCDLIFTRTIKGRKLVLKSRVKALAAQFKDPVERVNKWK